MMSSSDLSGDLSKLNLKDAKASLDFAEKLHRAGRVDESFRTLKQIVSAHSGDHKVIEEARQLTHRLMDRTTSGHSGLNGLKSPKELVECLRTGGGEVGDEIVLTFRQLSANPVAAEHLNRLGALPAGFYALLRSQGGTANSLILCQSLVDLIKSVKSIQELAAVDAELDLDKLQILFSTSSSSSAETSRDSQEEFFSSFLNLISVLQLQHRKLSTTAASDFDFSDKSIAFLQELTNVCIRHNDVKVFNLLLTFLLRLWPSRKFCRRWLISLPELASLMSICNQLLVSRLIEPSHVSLLLSKLHQATTIPRSSFHASESETKLESETDEGLEKQFCLNLKRLVGDRLDGTDEQSKIDGLRLLSTIFTFNAPLGSSILSSGNLLPAAIMDCLEMESANVQSAAIQLFSDACADGESRKLVRSHCLEYLNGVLLVSDQSGGLKTLAASVLSKLSLASERSGGSVGLSNLPGVSPTTAEVETAKPKELAQALLARLLDSSQNGSLMKEKMSALEGLSYISAKADVKELLQRNCQELMRQFDLLLQKAANASTASDCSTVVYGVALLLDNLTAYKRKRSEEEQQVQKLREYCKDALPDDNDERNSDAGVERRNADLVQEGGLLKVLTKLSTISKSPRVIEHASRTWASLATNVKLRGLLAQAGAVKTLLKLYQTSQDASKNAPAGSEILQQAPSDLGDGERPEPKMFAAHAIAKIAISLDPHIAFPQTALNMMRPLMSLLDFDNQLFQFEALLAITNLTSMDEERVGETAVSVRRMFADKMAMRLLEDKILSEHPRIQCAACELLCNLVPDDLCAEKWIEERGAVRMKIFVALTDAELEQTRVGCTGALAMLFQVEQAFEYAMEFERTPELLRRLVLAETSVGVLWRSLYIWNVVLKVCKKKDDKEKFIMGIGGGKKGEATLRARLQELSSSSQQSMQVREYAKLLIETLNSALK